MEKTSFFGNRYNSANLDLTLSERGEGSLKKIYTPPNNYLDNDDFKGPFPRYGHTMHLINNKLYVLGGEFEDWKKDAFKKDILWHNQTVCNVEEEKLYAHRRKNFYCSKT